jgi:putative transposase
MIRMARVVVPGYPHHVTQRGNRRQRTFFDDADFACYIDLMAEFSRMARSEVRAYCLMPNHVHLVRVPEGADGLRAVLSEVHRRHTRHINFRHGWRGHLWQERLLSFDGSLRGEQSGRGAPERQGRTVAPVQCDGAPERPGRKRQ